MAILRAFSRRHDIALGNNVTQLLAFKLHRRRREAGADAQHREQGHPANHHQPQLPQRAEKIPPPRLADSRIDLAFTLVHGAAPMALSQCKLHPA